MSVTKDPSLSVLQSMHDHMREGGGTLKKETVDYAQWVEVYQAMLEAARGES